MALMYVNGAYVFVITTTPPVVSPSVPVVVNATHIKGVKVDDAAKSDGKALLYDGTDDTIIYGSVSSNTYNQSLNTNDNVVFNSVDSSSIIIGSTGLSAGATSLALGHTSGSGTVAANGTGSVALGESAGLILVGAAAQGCIAMGHADANSSIGVSNGAYKGCVAGGCAINNGTIVNTADSGGFAFGHADNGTISAQGDGAFALGAAQNGQNIVATGDGALAGGSTVYGTVWAGNNGSIAWGDDVRNFEPYSAAFGVGVLATDFITGDPMGQIYRGAGRFTSGITGYSHGIVGMVLRARTTDATPTECLGGPNLDSKLILRNHVAWAVNLLVVGFSNDYTELAAYNVFVAVKRVANAASVAIVGSPTVNVITETTGSMDVSVGVDTTNGALTVTVTGLSSKNIMWTVSPNISEVMFA